MARAPRLAAAGPLLVLLAGCLGSGSGPDYAAVDAAVAASAFPALVQDHGSERGHFDAAAHASSLNLELVGYHNGVDESGDPDAINAVAPDGIYTELAIHRGYAYLSRASGSGLYGGFAILDVGDDPSRPFKVGEFAGLGSADIEVNAAGTLAFLATQRNTPQQMAASAGAAQDPFAALPRGISVVDVEDKAAPTLESFVPLPANGPHTITSYQHPDGHEYVVACTYDLLSSVPAGGLTGVVPVTQRVLVYRVVDEAGAPATLVPVSQYSIVEQAPEGRMYFPHDTRLQVHPLHEGQDRVLLYVAYWDKGVRILDLTDPLRPTEVGAATDFAPSRLNNIHLAQPFDGLVAGRHVTIAEPEIPQADGETGQITVLDTTDPASPQRLGRWTLPHGPQGQLGVSAFDFSPHNFDLWDGKVALGHFHAGVWVLDVGSEANLREPKAVAHYMPAIPRTDSPAHQPSVWGVFEDGGLLYAVDQATGLHVLRYTGP